jgi:hypothetical protein
LIYVFALKSFGGNLIMERLSMVFENFVYKDLVDDPSQANCICT